MTYFNAGTMERTISGVASYVDGVQLKIGDRFKPSERITLPINYLERMSHNDFSRFEYDFELENNILRKAEERRLQEEQIKLLKRQQISAETEANIAYANADVTPASNTANGATESSVAQISNGYIQEPAQLIQPRPAMLGMDILTPTPLATTSAPQKVTNQKPLINLADFENSATDPFEMTELKTLDDMEELRSVLEQTLPTSTSDATITDSVESQSSLIERKEQSQITLSDGDNEMKVEPVHDPVDQSSQFTAPLEMNIGGEMNGSVVTCPASSTAHFTAIKTAPQQSSNTPVYIYKQDSFTRGPPLPPIPPKKSSDDLFKMVNQDIGSNNIHTELSRTGTDLSITSDISSPNSRTGSSLEIEVQVPPSYPKSLNKYSCLPSKTLPSAKVLQEDENQIFTKLNTEQQHFTRSIAAMGFPLLRVAKVVEHNGCDSELVVEALCAIQRLCDKGFDESRVGEVLDFVSNDENKASEFLRLMSQFETLGFKSEDIKKQLIVIGTDEEKLLNALTQTS
ncbi:ubiquitin-associated protein 1-like [Anneissia japonica]|uniref:ubiquitin-associated protein 1-like n=1 Tax=Anneissia japonica TaxID=1529436 RepID=UPI0014256250|nr:ubiquitin-associated protein 1-like [Anneissia japonica]